MQSPLPPIPVKHENFVQYIQAHTETPLTDLVKPYNQYDVVARKIFAQEASHPMVKNNVANIAPLYNATGSTDIRTRARDLASESPEQKEKYILTVPDNKRRSTGSAAVVPTLAEFQNNFALFTEAALSDLDWSNVVAAGSAVVTSLLPVPEKYRNSKRGLRQYYHEEFAPASDVDLFLYGLTEEQAIEKIKHIEDKIRNTILYETTTIRTKNTITIASQYPNRHVQIVLRIYHSIAEILTGFDVDCSCATYDGKQVYASPRAIASYITQANQIDLTRRSPSYENRLSKYSHRGFEIFWPPLERARVDPTIFERSFMRTEGLARLLVLEKLPKSEHRESYLRTRREERGRPPLSMYLRRRQGRELHGNIKDDWEDEVPEWQEEDHISSYHTFTIPYGRRFNAKKIEKLLYTKDLLLNAQWNQPKDRKVYLHRHPAFFGEVEHVIGDCCGCCPQPITDEEQKIAEEESKTYISGQVSFIKDDPGRQEIGSFNPITETDWTEMAYVGQTELLCQAIVSHDLETVRQFMAQENANPDRRDYTGRTPLQLACIASTPEIVQCIVDHGARIIARMADGKTALHLAAARGNTEMVRILLKKSNENEEKEGQKPPPTDAHQPEDSDEEMCLDNASHTSASYVKIDQDGAEEVPPAFDTFEENELEPDIYDINVVAWDSLTSPLHLAILHGHVETVKELVTSFGADVLMPIKIPSDDENPRAALLTLVLALALPQEKAKEMSQALLQLGASPAQADVAHLTPLHYVAQSKHNDLLGIYMAQNEPAVRRAINHISLCGTWFRSTFCTPLTNALSAKNSTAAANLLTIGARATIGEEDCLRAFKAQLLEERHKYQDERSARDSVAQPILYAVNNDLPLVALHLLKMGIDPNATTKPRYEAGKSTLDFVRDALREMRSFLEREEQHDKRYLPERWVAFDKDSDSCLAGFEEGTYKMFFAKNQIKNARKENQTLDDEEKDRIADLDKSKKRGTSAKIDNIAKLILDYEKLEAEVLSKGGKTYDEVHGLDQAGNQSFIPTYDDPEDKPQAFKVEFFNSDLTATSQEGYVQLLEAAWNGDIETIKTLTLGVWGPGQDQSPLDVTVSDSLGFTCLTIAVLRGHLQVAKAVLQIVRTQYKAKEPRNNQKFEIDVDADSSDDEDINIIGHDVNDQFTHENVGEIVTQVDGTVSPREALQQICPASLFLEQEAQKERCLKQLSMEGRGGSSNMEVDSLFAYAIYKNDLSLLGWLLEVRHEFPDNEETRRWGFFCAEHQGEFQLAMALGHTECLSRLIQSTGAGLPLEKLGEESGVELRDEHQLYPGLSIRGKKRKDWANAGRPGHHDGAESYGRPPLLISAMQGNLTTTEWFLGTAPSRHYLEYVNKHLEDKTVQRLVNSKLGLDASVLRWLQSRNNLVLHCAVMSSPSEESERQVQYLVDHHPECLEVQSSGGHTPLALAFSLHRLNFARILINAGAKQTARDAKGCSLLHLLLVSIQGNACRKPESFSAMLGLLDQSLLATMLTQRAGENSQTPFASWLHRYLSFKYWNKNAAMHHGDEPSDIEVTIAMTQTLLDLGKSTNQRFLEFLDGSGNTPVHQAVKMNFCPVLRLVLDVRPDLLFRENATGSTALELAEDTWVNETTRTAPKIAAEEHGVPEWQNAISRRSEYWAQGWDSRSDAERLYGFCQERARQSSGKRRLVSILEANEVAKRLAAKRSFSDEEYGDSRYRRSKYGGSRGARQELDEVALWGGLASPW